MTEDILAPLQRLLAADTSDLRKLAELLGENPETFYISTDLSNVDLRGQDLRGMKLFRTNIERAIFDHSSLFDDDLAKFLMAGQKKRYLEVSSKLLRFTEKFFSKRKFQSRGWFIKAIVPEAAAAIRTDTEGWRRTLDSSKQLRSYFRSEDRDRIELTLAVQDYRAGQRIGEHFGGRGPALTALILVGLLRLIRFDPATDTVIPDQKKWLGEFKQYEDNQRKFL